MQTCVLIPGLVKKAKLLMMRHHAVIANEFEITTRASSFVRKHSEIDADIRTEKQKSNKVSKNFQTIDTVVISVFLCLFGTAWGYFSFVDSENKSINWIVSFLSPILDVMTLGILVVFAYILTRTLRKSTGKKQNTCLLIWHAVNMIILILILVMQARADVRFDSAKNSQEKEKYTYYSSLTGLVSTIIDIYVDLFLIWLLYLFIRP